VVAGWVAIACGRTPVGAGGDRPELDPSLRGCELQDGTDPDAYGPPVRLREHDQCEGLSAADGAFGRGANLLGPAIARCNPRAMSESEGWRCCSDDPAAPGGVRPEYAGISDGAPPYFSAANNDVGTSGMCVHVGDVEYALREEAALGCPVPCNPTWADEEVDAVCGAQRVCCQSRALLPEDCVVDPDLLPEEHYRPARGNDIGVRYPDGTPVTAWSAGAHVTHQDPSGFGCKRLAGNPPDSELNDNEIWLDCVAQLSVADQRGFCVRSEQCVADPACLDPCELMN
jgi:hypothetical protein